ncbi:MAG: Uma2 family endonuclease [Acidobacteria bacterium]|nr:Uma2 family endonuclease [Acidobacteriota bacterium]
MAGESPHHNTICVNLARELSLQLKGRPCRAHTQNIKVRTGPDPKTYPPPKGLYSYPDALVVCGEYKFHDQCRDVLLNPTVIFEVLSTTTEAFDRGDKFIRYRTWFPTFTDYVLISQTAPIIEHYRHENDEWILNTFVGLESSFKILSIDCTLKLNEIYDGIDWQAN